MKPLSKITIGLGIYIIVSASFMLQVRDYLARIFSDECITQGFFFLFFLAMVGYVLYILYNKSSVRSIMLSLFIFALAYFLMSWQLYFPEKMHILEYGILGYLALKDLSRENGRIKNVIYALCFVTLIGVLDEGFQRILPYRVFELRDIGTNILSGILGGIQYFIYRRLS